MQLYSIICLRIFHSLRGFSIYPFVERDVAMVLSADVRWDKIKTEAELSGGHWVREIIPFDIFKGESIGSDKKSVAFRIRLQREDRTLSDNEINDVINRIRQSLQEKCGAQLR